MLPFKTSWNLAGTEWVVTCLSLPVAPLMYSVSHKKGTNSISEKSFPTLLCPQLSFTKLCQVALSCHRDAQNKPPKHQDLNAALFAVWPVRQVKCRALVMFYGCPRHYRVGMHEGKKKKAFNIPPFNSEIHQMLQSLSDSNTSHITCSYVSLPSR